jgi:hypothetical protein
MSAKIFLSFLLTSIVGVVVCVWKEYIDTIWPMVGMIVSMNILTATLMTIDYRCKLWVKAILGTLIVMVIIGGYFLIHIQFNPSREGHYLLLQIISGLGGFFLGGWIEDRREKNVKIKLKSMNNNLFIFICILAFSFMCVSISYWQGHVTTIWTMIIVIVLMNIIIAMLALTNANIKKLRSKIFVGSFFVIDIIGISILIAFYTESAISHFALQVIAGVGGLFLGGWIYDYRTKKAKKQITTP